MFKPGQCAGKRQRRLLGFDDLAKVVTGTRFKDGVEVTTDNQVATRFNESNTRFDDNSNSGPGRLFYPIWTYGLGEFLELAIAIFLFLIVKIRRFIYNRAYIIFYTH